MIAEDRWRAVPQLRKRVLVGVVHVRRSQEQGRSRRGEAKELGGVLPRQRVEQRVRWRRHRLPFLLEALGDLAPGVQDEAALGPALRELLVAPQS